MKSFEIESLLKHLGLTHEELIEKNIVPDDDLIELFPGVSELVLEIDTGIDMNFDATTEKFQTLSIFLKNSTPSVVEYMGELPFPFKLKMTQKEVREALGSPRHYSGPVKMPEPMGQTGGWESYHLTAANLKDLELIVSYTESMDVDDLVFSNFRREDMYKPDFTENEQHGEPEK